MTLPYKGELACEILKRRITRKVNEIFPQKTVRFIFKSQRMINANAKDCRSSLTKSNIIYQFTCTCLKSYIGRSERSLAVRANEHLPSKALKSEKPFSSAITEHLITSSHTASMDNFKVIYQAKNRKMLFAYEASAIKRFSPALNIQKYQRHDLKIEW